MLAIEFITWWYSLGWLSLARRLGNYILGIYRYFSVALLAKTLFVPWKRITTYGSRSLNERLRAWLDNVISRLVGFSVRITVLFVAFILMLVGGIFAVVAMLFWPLLPLAVPVLLVKTVLP